MQASVLWLGPTHLETEFEFYFELGTIRIEQENSMACIKNRSILPVLWRVDELEGSDPGNTWWGLGGSATDKGEQFA